VEQPIDKVGKKSRGPHKALQVLRAVDQERAFLKRGVYPRKRAIDEEDLVGDLFGVGSRLQIELEPILEDADQLRHEKRSSP